MSVNLEEKAIALVGTYEGWASSDANDSETELYEVPTGKVFVPMFVVFRNISAAITAVITLGKTDGNCNEFRGDVTLTTALTGTTKYAIVHQQDSTRNTPDGGLLLTAGQKFGIEITTTDADGGTADIDVFGFLYDA